MMFKFKLNLVTQMHQTIHFLQSPFPLSAACRRHSEWRGPVSQLSPVIGRKSYIGGAIHKSKFCV
jgi:hypothetical protein